MPGHVRSAEAESAVTIRKATTCVVADNSLETLNVEIDERTRWIELHVESRPASLWVDPMFDVFRYLDPRETPASIGQVFGEPRIPAVLPASAAGGVMPDGKQLSVKVVVRVR